MPRVSDREIENALMEDEILKFQNMYYSIPNIKDYRQYLKVKEEIEELEEELFIRSIEDWMDDEWGTIHEEEPQKEEQKKEEEGYYPEYDWITTYDL